jgi:hypothetical protein
MKSILVEVTLCCIADIFPAHYGRTSAGECFVGLTKGYKSNELVWLKMVLGWSHFLRQGRNLPRQIHSGETSDDRLNSFLERRGAGSQPHQS